MTEKSLPEVIGDAITATSEAEKEKWKTAGKAVDAASGLGRFLEKVFGPLLEQLGGMAGDRVRFWRMLQTQRFASRYDAIVKARQIPESELKALPLSQSLPILEAASMEESDEVQDLWASLLASAMDTRSGVSVKKPYIAILREIGPAEAALLHVLFQFGRDRTVKMQDLDGLAKRLNAIAEERWRKYSKEDSLSALSNLRRLGCVSPDIKPPDLQNLIRRIEFRDMSGGSFGRPPEVNSIDPEKLQRLVQWILDCMESVAGAKETALPNAVPLMNLHTGSQIGKIPVPEFGLTLTPLGWDLMNACFGNAKVER
ncbi:MAG: Abi-alpha family protein [Reyranella sp.]